MNTKGQDLSLTTIIVAALGLLVLVVVAAIMTGQLGGFGLRLNTAQEAGACANACSALGVGDDGTPRYTSYLNTEGKTCDDGGQAQPSVRVSDGAGVCCCKLKA